MAQILKIARVKDIQPEKIKPVMLRLKGTDIIGF